MAKFNINSALNGVGSTVKAFTPAAIFAGLGTGIGNALEGIQTPIILLGGLGITLMILKK